MKIRPDGYFRCSINVGDHVKIGDQTLKVTDVDPDTLDVTLEDHSKYGVQKVADGQALYVEKVEPTQKGPGDEALNAVRPTLRAGEAGTGNLFQGDDQPFNSRAKRQLITVRGRRRKNKLTARPTRRAQSKTASSSHYSPASPMTRKNKARYTIDL